MRAACAGVGGRGGAGGVGVRGCFPFCVSPPPPPPILPPPASSCLMLSAMGLLRAVNRRPLPPPPFLSSPVGRAYRRRVPGRERGAGGPAATRQPAAARGRVSSALHCSTAGALARTRTRAHRPYTGSAWAGLGPDFSIASWPNERARPSACNPAGTPPGGLGLVVGRPPASRICTCAVSRLSMLFQTSYHDV